MDQQEDHIDSREEVELDEVKPAHDDLIDESSFLKSVDQSDNTKQVLTTFEAKQAQVLLVENNRLKE